MSTIVLNVNGGTHTLDIDCRSRKLDLNALRGKTRPG
jgi:hypothetical protein